MKREIVTVLAAISLALTLALAARLFAKPQVMEHAVGSAPSIANETLASGLASSGSARLSGPASR